MQVWRTDDGRHVEKLKGFCEKHGSGLHVGAIPVAEFCKGVGRKPIKPDSPAALLLQLHDRSWNYLRGGSGVGRTAGMLVRRGLFERERMRGGRVYYRLSEEGVHARALLVTRHVYYGPGSNVFNTPLLERAS